MTQPAPDRISVIVCWLSDVWERPPAKDLLGVHHIAITPYVAWLSPETELLPYTLAAQAAADTLGAAGAVS